MNEEANAACITSQEQPSNPDTTSLDTQIKQFPANSKDQTVTTLKFITEFRDKNILISTVKKYTFIDKLLNYLLYNHLLEVIYGTNIDIEIVDLGLIVLHHIMIIDSEINRPESYCLTANTLLNLVHMLTELPLSQPTLLSQEGCDIICTISKNYDGNYIFENLVTICSLNSFFANLCSSYLVTSNMESGGGFS